MNTKLWKFKVRNQRLAVMISKKNINLLMGIYSYFILEAYVYHCTASRYCSPHNLSLYSNNIIIKYLD